MNHFDVEKFPVKFAYTIDATHLGELQYECFNADGVKVHFYGKNIHPGDGYGKMVNALLAAGTFMSLFQSHEMPVGSQEKQ